MLESACVNDLVRLYELQEQMGNSPPEDAYSFDAKDNAVALRHFQDIEADLQGLDAESWRFLKGELIPLLTRRDEVRGWQALFDKLNEAKGYNYLTRVAKCSDVNFIPRSSRQGQKTPDLQGFLQSAEVLCEVKTINVSDDEREFRDGRFGVKSIVTRLPIEFFNKLKSTLEVARNQMLAYSASAETKKITYVVVNYDDVLHDYVVSYSAQVGEFISTWSRTDVEVVLDAKPARYFAVK
jgi:hypothetical protein